jgi:hypothetical protein
MLKTFSDLAVDVSTVVAVSKNVRSECGTGLSSGCENRSSLVLSPKDGRELVLEISPEAADSLIAYLKSQESTV